MVDAEILLADHAISVHRDEMNQWRWVECSCGGWRYTMNSIEFIATTFALHVLTAERDEQ